MKNAWPKKKLGDVILEIKDGGTPARTRPEYFGGDVYWCVVRDIRPQIHDTAEKLTKEGLNNCSAKVWPIDSVIISLGATIGQIGIAKVPTATKQGLSGIVVDRQQVTPEFLAYGLHEQKEYIQSLATGTTIKEIRPTRLKETISVMVPPLTEQQRIVGILDETFSGLAIGQANATKNLENARALFESHLQSVFAQKSEGWVDRQLDSLCCEITVGHVGPMKSQYKMRGIPFLRSQNIRPFEISLENVTYIDEEFHRSLRKSRLQPGDVAIVRTGYPGTAAVIPPELPESNCSDLVIVRPSEAVNPHFLAAFFNSAFGKRLVLGKIVGAAQKHFNVTAAKEVTLHVPPMPEQLRIVEVLKELRAQTQRLEDIYQRKLAALEAFKKSVLQQAFSGAL